MHIRSCVVIATLSLIRIKLKFIMIPVRCIQSTANFVVENLSAVLFIMIPVRCIQSTANFVVENLSAVLWISTRKNVLAIYVGANFRQLVVNIKCVFKLELNLHEFKILLQGTQLDVEKHESGNFHADLLIKLFLNLQTEQSNNASMLARSSFELLSLKDDNARRKSSAGVECDLKNAACNQDVNSQQSEFAINIKPKLYKLEETVKRQEMELNSCKQRITDLELKQTKLMAQNTQLEYNYGSVKDLLEQQSKEIEKLEKSLEFQVEYSNKKLEKDLDDLRLKQNGFELNYANSKEMLTKQQTEQFDNVENYQKTLNTVITANNRLTKAVAEDKKILSDKIDALSEKQIGFEDEYTRDKATFSYLWRIEKFEQQLDEAKLDRENAMYSHPFYSSKFGYKLQLLLCPNGGNQEDNEDTHLSIYLYVLKGVNDAILNWPIRYTAKYSILDQLNRKDHYSGTIESDVVNGLNRPLDEENMGYGIETYIELDKLKPLYLVDDTIFIKLDLNVTKKVIALPVKADQYFGKLQDQGSMLMSAMLHIKETGQTYHAEDDFRICFPEISITVKDRMVVGKPAIITANFTNPLNKYLIVAKFIFESPGLAEPREIRIS
uniref:MATH domain-containing protein n=1 Tax=Strigamia maritima TaxID=126957 RepID=T1IS12_STRMM